MHILDKIVNAVFFNIETLRINKLECAGRYLVITIEQFISSVGCYCLFP